MKSLRLLPALLAAVVSFPAAPCPLHEPPASVARAALLSGHYAVEGRNIDGTPYRGEAIVLARDDGHFELLWRIGWLQRGVGKLDGNLLTVDFGDAYPAIYRVESDGSLAGTWADGRASERLTPIGQQRI